MAETTVTLSDGQPCVVRRLGIFDLDGEGPEVSGPFRYTMTLLSGKEVEDFYDPGARSIPPVKPDVARDELRDGSPEWYAWLEWETYKAAIAHEYMHRIPSVFEFIKAISGFIATHAISEEDRQRVMTEEDWIKIRSAALVPEVSWEMITAVFRNTFQASYDDMEIEEARKRMTTSGLGKLDPIREAEIQAMAKFGYRTEDEWADLSIAERTRKIASVLLPKFMEALEIDRINKEMEAKNLRGGK